MQFICTMRHQNKFCHYCFGLNCFLCHRSLEIPGGVGWHFPRSQMFIWNLVLFVFEINKSLANDRKILQSIYQELIFHKFRFQNYSKLPECNIENNKIQDNFLVSPPSMICSKLIFKPKKSTVHSPFIASSETWKLSWQRRVPPQMVSVVIDGHQSWVSQIIFCPYPPCCISIGNLSSPRRLLLRALQKYWAEIIGNLLFFLNEFVNFLPGNVNLNEINDFPSTFS